MRDRGHPDSHQLAPLPPNSIYNPKHEHSSDIHSCATAVPETVMAEQVANDVVKEAQSVGRPAPIDDSASTTNDPAVNGDPPSGTPTTKLTPPEAISTKSAVNGISTTSAGGATMSQTAGGQAVDVSSDN